MALNSTLNNLMDMDHYYKDHFIFGTLFVLKYGLNVTFNKSESYWDVYVTTGTSIEILEESRAFGFIAMIIGMVCLVVLAFKLA